MKHLLALAVLFLSLNANAATIHDTIEFVNGSGSPFVGRGITPKPVCPTNSLCWTQSISVHEWMDEIVDYSEIRFLHKYANVRLDWFYKNANISANVGGKGYDLENNSGTKRFYVREGWHLEFYMAIESTHPQAEIQYTYTFSDILEEGQLPPVQPVPVPSALALMLPLFAGFTLRKFSVKTS